MAFGAVVPQRRGEPVESVASRGATQANALAGTAGALSDYMAARGATPIGGMGTTQGFGDKPVALQTSLQPSMVPDAGASKLFGPPPSNSAAVPSPKPTANAAAPQPTPGLPVVKKGRTTSMQRRGVGVGQPALRKKGGGGTLSPQPPITPAMAANDFIAQSNKRGVVPFAQPVVAAGPVSDTTPAPLNTTVQQ